MRIKIATEGKQKDPQCDSLLRTGKLIILLTSLLFIGMGSTYAQTTTISGTIKDANDTPLIGATVLVKGTNTATMTGLNGDYSIVVPGPESILSISYIGYNDFEIKVDTSRNVNVVLQEKLVELSEVVVVGYGSQIRRELTGSISKIDAKEIGKLVNATFETALQGRVSGIQIVQSSGAAGAGPMVRIRGIGTAMGNAQPLYVIDGVPLVSEAQDDLFFSYRGVAVSPLSNINSNDIESIEVLKDAYAGAIYGSRAANGVIIITTKKGKPGSNNIMVETSAGYLMIPRRVNFLDGPEWRALRKEAWVNSFGTVKKGPPTPTIDYGTTYMDTATYNNTNVDYMDELLRVGRILNTSVTASGGNENSQYLLSGTYKNENGVQIGDMYNNLNLRLNLQTKVNRWLAIGMNSNMAIGNIEGNAAGTTWTTMYGKETGVFNLNGGWATAVKFGVPVIPVYDPNNPLEYYNLNDFRGNVVAAADVNIKTMTNTNQRLLGDVFAIFTITPELQFRSDVGMDNYNSISQIWRSGKINSSGLAYAEDSRYMSRNVTFDNYFSYKKEFNPSFTADAVLGSSIQRSFSMGVNAAGRNIPSDQLHLVSQASEMIAAGSTKSDYAFNSFFLRGNMKFFSKYLFGLSARYDGSSRFGVNNKYGFFPAASAGWLISEESFLKDVSFISFLKIRGSFGLTGNAGTGNYDYLATYSTADEYGVAITYNGYPAITPQKLPSDDLKWEKSFQSDIGLEFGFLDNKISGTFGFYNKKTIGMFSQYAGPPSMGFELNTVMYNTGSMRNRGVEIDVNAAIITKKSFSWNTSLNISHNQNKILDWGALNQQRLGAAIRGEDNVISQPGKSMGLLLISEYAFVDKETGEMLIYEFADGNGTPLYNTDGSRATISLKDYTKWEFLSAESDPVESPRLCPDGQPRYFRRVFTEKPTQPKFIGGFTNNFQIFGFDLSVLFTFSYGNYMYDGSEGVLNNPNFEYMNMRSSLKERWQNPGDVTDVPKLYWNEGVDQTYSKVKKYDWGTPFVTNSRYLFDASYLRLQMVSLGYSFKNEWLSKNRITKLRVYATGQNIFLLTKFPGWEVESYGGGTGYWGNFRANAFANDNLPMPRSTMFGLQLSF